jgi:hypothetical protein
MKASKFEKIILVLGFLGLAMLLPTLFASLGMDLSGLPSFVGEKKEVATFIGLGLIALDRRG